MIRRAFWITCCLASSKNILRATYATAPKASRIKGIKIRLNLNNLILRLHLMRSRNETRSHPSGKAAHIRDDMRIAFPPVEKWPTNPRATSASSDLSQICPYTIPIRFRPRNRVLSRWKQKPKRAQYADRDHGNWG